MSDPDIPWPKNGDVLFRHEEREWWHNACVGWPRDDRLGYTEGYRRATEQLLEHVLSSHRDHDTLVYPIIFCARHYFEIKLKYLFIAASSLLDKPWAISPRHPLTPRWQDLRPLLEEIFPGHDSGELAAVEAIVREFDSRDASSMAFRYSEDTKGTPHQPSASTIDLATFQTTFKNVSSFLESCDTAIQEYAASRQD